MTLGIREGLKQMFACLVSERLQLRMSVAQSRDSGEKGWLKPGLDLGQVKGCQVSLSKVQARNGVQKDGFQKDRSQLPGPVGRSRRFTLGSEQWCGASLFLFSSSSVSELHDHTLRQLDQQVSGGEVSGFQEPDG